MSAALQNYLSNIVDGDLPDLVKLRDLGLPVAEAVSICEKWRASAPKVAALPISPPAPAPIAKPKEREPIGRIHALSLLHELAMQIDAERGCPTLLHNAGFSKQTAEELAFLINSSRRT